MGWGEVRPGVVPDVGLLRLPHRMREVASDLASAFPASWRTGCCPDVLLDRLDRPGHLGRRGDCRTSVRRGLPVWACPGLERRGCCRDEPANGRLASGQSPAWEPSLVWERHPASEQRLASVRSHAVQAWPARTLRLLPELLPRCHQPWSLQPASTQQQVLPQASRPASRRSTWLRALPLQVRFRLRRLMSRLPWRRAEHLAWRQSSHRAWVHRASLRALRPAWLPTSSRRGRWRPCLRWTLPERNRRMLPSPSARRVLRGSRKRSERIRPGPGVSRGRFYL